MLLATICKANEVIFAIPEGVSPEKCARMALPILSQKKVLDMLRLSCSIFLIFRKELVP